VYLLGSAKFSNEGAYLFRKFAAFWGTNNVDHQARICHSTTVAGVANTWGYGAQTNSYNDIRNSKTVIFMGSNAAEAHPVSLQHILEGKETQRANVIVIDPRFTRTAAHATDFIRMRSGTDIAVVWGIMWHIFENGWEDTEFLAQRVWGMDQVRAEVAKYPPAEVERITGIKEAELRRVAETFATQKPSTFIWCMGGTQHTVGTANVRAYYNLLLATGNVGRTVLARTSSAAIATSRAPLTSGSISGTCPATTGLPPGRGGTGRGSGTCPTTTSWTASMRCRRRAVATRARRKRTWRCRAFRPPAGSMRHCWTRTRSTSATTSRR
jgi:formate dehydrogenase major subunit